MIDISLLEKLCLAYGPSGDEDEVREIILNEIKDTGADISADGAGNIIVFKKGRRTPEAKLMFAAHMDEVGFMVNEVTGDGYLKFLPVGGIDPAVAAGKDVTVGFGRYKGVIGAKPIHLIGKEERSKVRKLESMYIDIGVVKKEKDKDKEKDSDESKEEREKKLVEVGETAVFRSQFLRFGEENKFVKCKAIDDRFGCLILINMIKSELEHDAWFAFTSCEEIGMRGAYSAAYKIGADIAVVLEATTAGDIYTEAQKGGKRVNKVCRLGGGAVISMMDNSAIYDRELVHSAMELAGKKGISAQLKEFVSGGNDSGAIQTSANGARMLAISLPTRYLHSPSVVASLEDMQACEELSHAFFFLYEKKKEAKKKR